MKFRSIFLTVLMLFSLAIGASVNAQDDMMEDIDLCFGLAEEDCAVVNDALANGLGDAESYTVDVAIDFAGSELSALFELVAGFGLDVGAIGDINAATFTVEGTFDMIEPADDMDGGQLSGSYVATWSQNDGDITEVAMDVIIIDNIMYMNQGEGWQSVDLDALEDNEALAGQLDMLGMGGDDAMDDDMTDDAAGALDLGGLTGVFGLIDLPGFISLTRDGDDFTFNIDFAVLQQLLEEENEDLLNELILTASEIDPTMGFFIPLLPTLITDGQVSVVQTVDTDLNVVTAFDVDTNLVLALGMLQGSTDMTSVDLTADIAFSNFNGVGAIEAPTDAVDVTEEFAEWAAGLFPEPEMEETEESGE